MLNSLFHPIVADWFRGRFREPTDAQRLGWPEIASGRNTLIAAPTGSGKTLAAFLFCLDRLFRESLSGETQQSRESIATPLFPLDAQGGRESIAVKPFQVERSSRDRLPTPSGVQVVYVSPLKALSNDIRRNLEIPLRELREAFAAAGHDLPPIRALVRTGDTPQSERQGMLRRPPQILVTTPESLFIVLTSAKGRELLRGVHTVIVDEIHALARDKRGAHLTLSLERLAALCDAPPQRIGLSATQKPMDEIARFLVGSGGAGPLSLRERVRVRAAGSGEPLATKYPEAAHPHPGPRPTMLRTVPGEGEREREPDCAVIDVGHLRDVDLDLEVPPSELDAVCTHETWGEIYDRLVQLIQAHRSTLVFVNTRRLAERVAHQLIERLGENAVASHHGSLSREIRLAAEDRLKAGELKAIVATASLEMGIDVGYIDLVCQISSPRSIATFLQRVGRSGHSLGARPKGRLIPLTRDELMECLALLRAVRGGRLDRIEMPQAPLDILAQQIVAAAASDDCDEDELFDLCRRAWPFRNVSREAFEEVLTLVSEGVAPSLRRGAYVQRDQIHRRLHARRGARLAAITSGGAIPETADFRVVTEEDQTFVGTVNEDFALESLAGDVFILGSTSWRIRYVRGGEVIVSDAAGAPATIPFWLGEAPGRTVELSQEVSRLREEVAERISVHQPESQESSTSLRDVSAAERRATMPLEVDLSPAANWLREVCGVGEWAAQQAARYVAAEKAAIGAVPTQSKIIFERFFDESGGMQLVIHAPLGMRINRAWGLALRKRFCRSFDFELQAAADDNGIVLSLSPQHSFPIDALFKMISPDNGEYLLTQALLAAPMFPTRWRWNLTRSLAVLRQKHGKRVPPQLQRFQSDDLLAAVFPQQTGCFENHHGDVEIPNHPLVRQTVHDCLHEAMDLPRWLEVLRQIRDGEIEMIAKDTREPSPFCHALLNSNPYTFLDPAPLEERRARAVATRRGLNIESVRDLGRLDPEAIRQVAAEAWPEARDADELHDVLLSIGALRADEGPAWRGCFDELRSAGRACHVERAAGPPLWIAAERWPMIEAIMPDAVARPEPRLPEALRQVPESAAALVAILRGRLQCSGPTTAGELAARLGLDAGRVSAALTALEAEGTALRGQFTQSGEPREQATNEIEWCDRRLLARIHRYTLEGLRRRIQPVTSHDYVRFLTYHHQVLPDQRRHGVGGVREALRQLQGYELPAGSWEGRILSARVADYDPAWLDELSLGGEIAWGRLRPPQKNAGDPPSGAPLTRAAPLSIVFREDVAWLLPPERESAEAFARGPALLVHDALRSRGALFPHELRALTNLLPAHLDEALHELAALGLVTADAFGAIRPILSPKRRASVNMRRHRRKINGVVATVAPSGRWSLFPGIVAEINDDERAAKWIRQLLNRWGVVFRDVVERESTAPPWYRLVPLLRRMEARGEVHGGRFITGVSGEQYASPDVVARLRRIRDEAPSGQWVVLSAADPLNLAGVLTDEPRVSAKHTFTVALRDGRLIATQQSGLVDFYDDVPVELKADLSRRMKRVAVG